MSDFDTNTNYPKESEAQRIGQDAASTLIACRPKTWRAQELDGDLDYGIDYRIQTIDDGGLVKQSFYLQLKGTESPNYNVDGKHITLSFKTSTLNYYRSQDTIVMVAIADLTTGETRSDTSIYYKWLDDDFFIENETKLSDQDYISINVETGLLVNINLNVNQYLQHRTSELLKFKALKSTLTNQGLDPAIGLQTIDDALKNNPSLYGLIESESNSKYPWLSEDHSGFSQSLKKSLDLINRNKPIEAESILSDLSSELEHLSEHEHAEYLSQKAALCFRLNDYESGIELARQASEVTTKRRYKLAYYELLFFDENLEADPLLEQIYSDLDLSISDERLIAAKCLVTLGRSKEVTSLFQINDEWPLLDKLQVFSMLGDEESFHAVKDQIDIGNIDNDNRLLLYYVLTGQKLYHEVIGGKEKIGSQAPVFGREDYDYEKFAECLNLLRKAWTLGETLGYPISLEHLLNESVQVFSSFNVTDELIAHVDSFYSGRPENQNIAYCLVVLKSNASDFKGTLTLIENINKKLSPELASLLIYSNYRLGNYDKVVKLTDQYGEQIRLCGDDTKYRTWGIALQCARAIFDSEKESELTQLMESSDDGTISLAIADYFHNINSNPKDKEKLELSLFEKFKELDKPIEIAEQLFKTVNVSPHSAPKVIELAETILPDRRLSYGGYIQYLDALIANDDWPSAEKVCDSLLLNNPNDVQWNLFKSAALEQRGELKEALNVLEQLAQDDRAVIHNIAELSFRMGKVDEAIEKLITLLNIENEPLKKLRVLELLIFIYSNDRGKFQGKLNASIKLYGRIVDQDDEYHEGRYLLKHLLLSSTEDARDIDEFRDRLNKYTTSFPNSIILKSIKTPVDASGQEIVEKMSELTGITDDKVKHWEAARKRISTGDLVIPFCQLDKLLPDTSDIYASWVLSKSLPPERRDFKFRHSGFNSTFTWDEIKQGKTKLLLDNLTVIILTELNVLNLFLKSVENVYFDRENYATLQQASHPIMGSTCWQTAKNVFDVLTANIDKITLVGASEAMAFQRYQEILGTGDYTFACDDAYLVYTALVDEPDQKIKVINTINILLYLCESNLLTTDQYYDKLGLFCSYGVLRPSIRYVDLGMMMIGNGAGTVKTGLNNDSFKKVFDRVFEYNLNSFEQDLDTLMHIFVIAYSQPNIDPKVSDITEILDLFALRHSNVQFDNIYALWLTLFLSILTPGQPGSSGFHQPHKKLLDTYREIYFSKFGHDQGFSAQCQPVFQQIQKLGSPQNMKACSNLIRAFESGSREIDLIKFFARDFGINLDSEND